MMNEEWIQKLERSKHLKSVLFMDIYESIGRLVLDAKKNGIEDESIRQILNCAMQQVCILVNYTNDKCKNKN